MRRAARLVTAFVLAAGPCSVLAADDADDITHPPIEFFWRDRVLSPKGYFIITKSRRETEVIDGLRISMDRLPRNKNFECEPLAGKIEKAVDEGNDRDSFFFSLPTGQRALLTLVDVRGDYSRAYRPKEFDIIRVGDSPGTISLVVAREGSHKTRWGVGWKLLGAAALLYIEDRSPPLLSKEQVLEVAGSVRCRRL